MLAHLLEPLYVPFEESVFGNGANHLAPMTDLSPQLVVAFVTLEFLPGGAADVLEHGIDKI